MNDQAIRTDRNGRGKSRLNVWIDAEMMAIAKTVAAETDRPLSSLVTLALRRLCNDYAAMRGEPGRPDVIEKEQYENT